MSELTEEQKLVKLGIRSPNQTESAGAETIQTLKDNISSSWATFQENFEDANLSDWSGFQSWIEGNGVGSDASGNITTRLSQKYASWGDFKDIILNQYESWEEFSNDFASNYGIRSSRKSDSGQSAAGVRVYEESGIGRAGQNIPAGGVEVYGREVHFSQTGEVRDTEDESAGTETPIVWSGLTLSESQVELGHYVDVSADVTNNTSFTMSITAELIIDGSVEDSKTVSVNPGTVTVSFRYWTEEIGSFDVSISETASKTLGVIYEEF